MRTICLYFQIHQPFRLRRFRFFDIGKEHYYYDDYSNESFLRKIADRSYLKANKVLLDIIQKNKDKFKIAFSISGSALDQFELYAPEVIKSFKVLAETGQVEFLCETDSHSLASLSNPDEFQRQVLSHRKKIEKYFGQIPTVFSNSELIYSDQIGEQIANMGFEGIITEGAKHILGWKSPNYLYCSAINPRLKLLLRNFKLSDDISFRFSNKNWNQYPLTTEKFANWLNHIDKREENVNIFIDYETFGGRQSGESGIFEFLKHMPQSIFKLTDYTFSFPTDIIRNQQPVSSISVPTPISWADEERDLTAWLGNDLQKEAFGKLYGLCDLVEKSVDPKIKIDWKYLQASDHFYYMSTKFFTDRPSYTYVNPYESPYDAFINYMNVLSDFTIRVKKDFKDNITEQKVDELIRLLAEKDKEIVKYQNELSKTAQEIEKPLSTKNKKKIDSEQKNSEKKSEKKKETNLI